MVSRCVKFLYSSLLPYATISSIVLARHTRPEHTQRPIIVFTSLLGSVTIDRWLTIVVIIQPAGEGFEGGAELLSSAPLRFIHLAVPAQLAVAAASAPICHGLVPRSIAAASSTLSMILLAFVE